MTSNILFDARARRALYEKADRPCSALAFNCLQLACCIPQGGRGVLDLHDADGEIGHVAANPATWMQQLAQIDAHIKLRDLVLPGTHDSASYTIPWYKPMAGIGKTQNYTILEQLQAGARYLDIRIAESPGAGIAVFHGCLQGGGLSDVLAQVGNFISSHAGEFVIVELVPEFGRMFGAAKKLEALDVVRDALSTHRYTASVQDWIQHWTLDHVQSTKKQVLVLLHERFYEKFSVDGVTYDRAKVQHDFGMDASQQWMRSHWHNTRNVRDLLKGNLDDLAQHNKPERYMHCSQMVLTPGVGGVPDVVNALLGVNSLRPVSLALKVYDQLDDWMVAHANEPWNICMLDFIDLSPPVLCFLISLNFPVKLDIRVAMFKKASGAAPQEDVTEKLRSTCLCRDRVLYCTKPDLVLGKGTLLIAYKMGNNFAVAVWTTDPTSQLLLGRFCSNCPQVKLPAGINGGFVVVEDGTPRFVQKMSEQHNKGPHIEFEREDKDVFHAHNSPK